ncbi:MAG: Na+-transporting NADH:ubiquinone oxidoreductase subunit C [Sphingobacteriales bacterium]
MRSNTYTFGFATIVILVAALLLSSAATLLKDRQVANEKREKKALILKAAGIETEEIDAKFAEVIIAQVINQKGEIIEGVEAFNINLLKQNKALKSDPTLELNLPIYTCNTPEGKRYVFPMYGKGLWGPIWGYVALGNDLNTITGAIFDHKGETPGLGAEISTPIFEDQFAGKEIYEKGALVSIDVLKGAGNNLSEHEVDGISGGTITSVGVEDMLKTDFGKYQSYLDKIKSSI